MDEKYIYFIMTGAILGLSAIAWYFIKKHLNKFEKTLETHGAAISKMSVAKAVQGVNSEVTQKAIKDIQDSLVAIREETKCILKIDGKIALLTEQINKIPKMEKDMDAAHHLIREMKGSINNYIATTEKMIKMLRSRTHYLMNKLMFFKIKAESSGWKLDDSDWRLPREEDEDFG